MTNVNYKFQVVIVGGGPAGIATSLTLSSRGIKHCIVEAQQTPVFKPGEAIPPNAKPLLRQLGISHLLDDKQHQPYYGNNSCWGSEKMEKENFISDIHGHGYLVNRSHFEWQLQSKVKSTDASFFSGYRLTQVAENNNNVIIKIQNENETIELIANYVVDATGKKASVCRHFGVVKKVWDEQFALISEIDLPYDAEQQIFIEATSNGWWYIAPLHKNRVSMMFFTLKELLPKKDNIKSFLKTEFETTIHLSSLFKETIFRNEQIKIMPAGTSNLEIPYGKHWMAVGDAAFSYDPISSYGITSALASGYYGGHALADTCLGKDNAFFAYRYITENAFEAYQNKLIAHYTTEKRWKNNLYWKKRLSTYMHLET
ncbi:NAD(P)/FAD-dependent oxidoreductase [Aquimarina sp. 2201CG5-10]|uniref:NAD(P)/FAD-dependent oxidoreductase n=1 Tax=Aquimarina callyspongiae TaxID=3098150 RepID=UPI002AB335B3|nr:NAD(P)/FAD-dependent oxidoreductase [Aquimarina sp. 2201CG5-10]MDY8135676.1 NAD(P)/FAD-dependent oxidoreductase [Aquimarina sp. 2201CG5-10]